MEIYIIRHGQTVWNAKKLLQGSTDIELNENGRELAGETGRNLESVLSSIFWKGWIFPVFMWTEAQKEVQRVMHGIL